MNKTEEELLIWFEELSYEKKEELYEYYKESIKEDDDFLENFEWEDEEDE